MIMKKSLLQMRMPTPIAILILLGGLWVTSILIQRGVFTVSKASPEQAPQNIIVTNLTPSSFTVAFTTKAQVLSGVNIVSTNPPGLFFDQGKNAEGYVSHNITISDLKPQTTYEFEILSGGETYLDQGSRFSVTTPASTSGKKPEGALTGTVLLPDGTVGENVLILVKINGAAIASTLTNSKGEYSLPLSLIRTDSHNEYFNIQNDSKIDITAIQEPYTSNILYAYQNGQQIPVISLSNNYSFIAEGTTATASSVPLSELRVPASNKKARTATILTPTKNQSFVDFQPQFRGTANTNTLVKISISDARPIQVQVKSDGNGLWAYRPAVKLSSGLHTITIQTADSTGALKSLSQTFNIFADGTQVAESATPSATPTVLLPTQTPTPSPTLGASPNPTVFVPIPTPTILAQNPSPAEPIAIIPTKIPLPPTGDSMQSIFLTSMAALFIVLGSALFFIL